MEKEKDTIKAPNQAAARQTERSSERKLYRSKEKFKSTRQNIGKERQAKLKRASQKQA